MLRKHKIHEIESIGDVGWCVVCGAVFYFMRYKNSKGKWVIRKKGEKG